jgi:hypothetical protein
MPSSGMLRRVALVSTEVSQEPSALVFLRRVHRFLVTVNVVRSSLIFVTLIIEELGSSETPFITRTTLRNFPEDGILYIHRRKNLKFNISLAVLQHPEQGGLVTVVHTVRNTCISKMGKFDRKSLLATKVISVPLFPRPYNQIQYCCKLQPENSVALSPRANYTD